MRNPMARPLVGEKLGMTAVVLLWLLLWAIVLTQVAVPLGEVVAL